MYAGLVSISFRRLTAEQVVAAVAQAGLDGIEWGGDIHVPHGDLSRAREVGCMTRDAGLQVASYGSYYRAGIAEGQGLPFEKVLDSATALQAPTIRVWAGARGSGQCDPTYRRMVIEDARRIAALAAACGITVAFEYHRNTLTDSRASACALLEATADAGIGCYWQPTSGWSHAEQLASLHELLPWLTNLHVYQWDPQGDRHPLAGGVAAWREFLAVAATAPLKATAAQRWALLEFVRDDQIEQFQRDAATLRQLLANGV